MKKYFYPFVAGFLLFSSSLVAMNGNEGSWEKYAGKTTTLTLSNHGFRSDEHFETLPEAIVCEKDKGSTQTIYAISYDDKKAGVFRAILASKKVTAVSFPMAVFKNLKLVFKDPNFETVQTLHIGGNN